MSSNNVVFGHNLSSDFLADAGTKKFFFNVDGTSIVRDSVTGKLKVDVTALAIGPSADAGNLLTSGADNKLMLSPTAIKGVVVPSVDAGNTITAGTDGNLLLTADAIKTVTAPSVDAGNLITVDGAGRHFIDVEAIQDAIGLAIAAGVGITYDDAMNSISSAVGNLAFGDTDSVDLVVNTATTPGTSAVTALVKLDSTTVGNLLKVVVGQGLAVSPSDIWALIEPAVTYTSVEVDLTDPLLPTLKHTITVNGVAKTASVPLAEISDAFGVGQGMYVIKVVQTSPTTWTFRVGTTAPDAVASDNFGISVSLNSTGTVLAVGAHGQDSAATDGGKVYLFDVSGNTTTLRTTVVASDAVASDNFGVSVSLNSTGTVLAVGAQAQDSAALNAGKVYLFDVSGSTTTLRTAVVAPDAAASDNFGISVSLNSTGTVLAVGARGQDSAATDGGKVYLFDVSGSTTTLRTAVVAPDAAASDNFGRSVSLNSTGTLLVVGAQGQDSAAVDTGKVYLFDGA